MTILLVMSFTVAVVAIVASVVMGLRDEGGVAAAHRWLPQKRSIRIARECSGDLLPPPPPAEEATAR
jgi:hypothetical protein